VVLCLSTGGERVFSYKSLTAPPRMVDNGNYYGCQ